MADDDRQYQTRSRAKVVPDVDSSSSEDVYDETAPEKQLADSEQQFSTKIGAKTETPFQHYRPERDENTQTDARVTVSKTIDTLSTASLSDMRRQIDQLSNQLNAMAQSCDKISPATTTDMARCCDSISTFVARQAKMDLPKFSGHPDEWPLFVSEYRRTTDAGKFSPQENVGRLRDALRGDALESVRSLLISPDSADRIIQILERRFGRPQFIIETLIAKTRALPSPKEDRPESIIAFATGVENLVVMLELMDRPEYLNNPELVKTLERKLPPILSLMWSDYLGEKVDAQQSVNLRMFSNWLERKSYAASLRISFCDKPKTLEMKQSKSKVNTVVQTTVKCRVCDGVCRTIDKCAIFIEMDIDCRWKEVTKNKLCFSCLKPNHTTRLCSRKKRCGKDECQKYHHHLLHPISDQSTNIQCDDKPISIERCHSGAGTFSTRLRVVPVFIKNSLNIIRTFALLDPGSTTTLIKMDMAEKLGVKGPKSQLTIQWANGTVDFDTNSEIVTVEICGTHKGARTFNLHNARTVASLHLPRQTVDKENLIKKWPYLQNIDFEGYVDAIPTILIGEDNGLLIVTRQLVHTTRNCPIASKTWLGWSISGNDSANGNQTAVVKVHCATQKDVELHELVKQSFKLDDACTGGAIAMEKSREDNRAIDIMEKTTRQLSDGRWEIGLPWRRQDIVLPDSKQVALTRLYQLEKKLDKNHDLKTTYNTIIKDHIEKGYLVKTNPDSLKGDRLWYLPHFAVTNPNKPGKIRMVLDARAKVSGVSLNDALLTGPDLLQSLPGVLMRFRGGILGFIADIAEMFHRIAIRDEDSYSQLLLWRADDCKRPPDVYRMTAMIFGACCSPSSAIFVLNKNAERFKDKYPDATRAIQRNHYMDDYLGSANDIDVAKNLIKNIIEIHSSGGFELRNWCSSSPELLEDIPKELQHANSTFKFDKEADLGRVLGLAWCTRDDIFTFSSKLNIDKNLLEGRRCPTKREVLKLVMSIFDPLGFVAHFVIVGRILIQEIWKSGIDWDDELEEEQRAIWFNWIMELRQLDTVRVPRCYSPNFLTTDHRELHVFVDASEQAYAAVAYVRIKCDDNIQVAFVAARAKCCPIKYLTTPKKELQAAQLGARLAVRIKLEHDVTFRKTYYWGDSTSVLSWIRDDAKRFKQFYANRLSEIAEMTETSDWYWVPTGENVADIATRATSKEFTSNSRWFRGPEFLRQDESTWQKRQPNRKKDDCHTECVYLVAEIGLPKQPYSLPAVTRFSSWLRLIRTTAYVIRYVKNCRAKSRIRKGQESTIRTGELAVIELEQAENIWIRQCQRIHFGTELSILRKGGKLPISSRLYRLTPEIEEKIIRMKTRTTASDDPTPALQGPIILHGYDDYVSLLVAHYHRQAHHVGFEMTLNELRQRFWIMKVRPTLKRICNECNTCKIRRSKPASTIMGQLPKARLMSGCPAFSYTGVDYFGPLMVTVGRRKEKRYGVLFTCLTTRAIHIELAQDLSTDCCIQAITRFISRRGCPKEMFSDNGTNFRGANNELRDCLRKLDVEVFRAKLTTHRIKWTFIPPSSPHMGGAWERLVRSVKTSLFIVLKDSSPREDTLSTFLTQVEHLINSRPLVEVSHHPDDPEALTPNHFLIGRSSMSAPISDFNDKDLILRRQWRHSQRLADHFWHRWRKEYLPTLQKTTKWYTPGKDVKVGDVVLVVDDNEIRGNWPKGVIQQVYRSKQDGKIRVVDVKTAKGVYKRPIVKLCVLDFGNDGSSHINTGAEDVNGK